MQANIVISDGRPKPITQQINSFLVWVPRYSCSLQKVQLMSTHMTVIQANMDRLVRYPRYPRTMQPQSCIVNVIKKDDISNLQGVPKKMSLLSGFKFLTLGEGFLWVTFYQKTFLFYKIILVSKQNFEKMAPIY